MKDWSNTENKSAYRGNKLHLIYQFTANMLSDSNVCTGLSACQRRTKILMVDQTRGDLVAQCSLLPTFVCQRDVGCGSGYMASFGEGRKPAVKGDHLVLVSEQLVVISVELQGLNELNRVESLRSFLLGTLAT